MEFKPCAIPTGAASQQGNCGALEFKPCAVPDGRHLKAMEFKSCAVPDGRRLTAMEFKVRQWNLNLAPSPTGATLRLWNLNFAPSPDGRCLTAMELKPCVVLDDNGILTFPRFTANGTRNGNLILKEMEREKEISYSILFYSID